MNTVIGLGVKGADLVMSTFKKIQSAKHLFEKPASAKFAAGRAKIEAQKQQQRDWAKEDKRNAFNEEKKSRDKEQFENSKLVHATRNVSASMEKMAGGFASLNPVELIRSVSSAVLHTGGSLVGSIIGVFSDKGQKLVDGATEKINALTDFAIQAASGALASYKNSLSITADRRAQESQLKLGGAGALNQSSVLHAEASALSQALFPVIGKIQANTAMEKQLIELFKSENGQAVNRNQANALAQGDFSALGNTKGWLLNQISGAFAGLPPEIVQSSRAALIGMARQGGELGKENVKARVNNKVMTESDILTQTRISNADKEGAMGKVNNSLNNLSVNMVENAGKLTGTLGDAANGVSSFVSAIASSIAKLKNMDFNNPVNAVSNAAKAKIK